MNIDVLQYLYDVAILAWQLHHAIRNRIISTKAVKRRSICSEKTVPCRYSYNRKWLLPAHILPRSKNIIGTSTCFDLRYSPTPFPKPSILAELAIPPSRKSMMRLRILLASRLTNE